MNMEAILQSLQQAANEPTGLVFSLVLGFLSAATSACCTLPALGIIAGYSGTVTDKTRKDVLRSAALFTLGTILALMILGGIAGFVGQVAQVQLGRYWKLFAGLVAIVFGLATLQLLPLEVHFGNLGQKLNSQSLLGKSLAGLLLGGVVAISSLPCNPGIFIVLGAAVLQGKVLWASALLLMFAVGFSIPLGFIMFGISFGGSRLSSPKANRIIRWASGIVLLAAGFYFLITL